MTVPVAFRDIPASFFPFTIEFIGLHSGRRHDIIHVKQPGVVRIPPMSAEQDEPIATVIWFANSEVAVNLPEDTPADQVPIYEQLLAEMRDAAARRPKWPE